MTAWQVDTIRGRAADLLALPPTERRAARVLFPEDRALVLGSTQPDAQIDRRAAVAAGVSVLRRASGGGAVLVGPGEVLWADVVVPAGDRLWQSDVGRAFWWLGEVWAAALAAAGVVGAEVWRGGLVRTDWSDKVCFAGLGPGEVRVGGAKVVGMAQRRSRLAARFQCAVSLVWRPRELVDLLVVDDAGRAAAVAALAPVAAGVGPGVAERLVSSFLTHLPT